MNPNKLQKRKLEIINNHLKKQEFGGLRKRWETKYKINSVTIPVFLLRLSSGIFRNITLCFFNNYGETLS